MEERTQVNGSLALEQRRLIVIEPTQRPEAAKLRVAAYARVSSASDDQLNSFAAQARHFTALISANDHWSLADIYADEGITGTSAQKREDFQRLLADCRRGLVDKVITKSVSRFARNVKDCLEAIRELKVLGIGVYFEQDYIKKRLYTTYGRFSYNITLYIVPSCGILPLDIVPCRLLVA